MLVAVNFNAVAHYQLYRCSSILGILADATNCVAAYRSGFQECHQGPSKLSTDQECIKMLPLSAGLRNAELETGDSTGSVAMAGLIAHRVDHRRDS